MELIIILLLILQSIAISLGVGSSTLAIINFFVAIADGRIDENERRMMGVVYVILRVAMALILLTSGALTLLHYSSAQTFLVALWTLIAVLYINAILMTKRIMPSTIGPALQASSWYTLGVTMTLFSLGLVTFSALQFYLGYAVAILLAVSLVNGTMAILKHKRESKEEKTGEDS
jgi:hypothetical protein